MSLENFITDILNIKLEDLENIDSIVQGDNSLLVKLRLRNKPDVSCPYCRKK